MNAIDAPWDGTHVGPGPIATQRVPANDHAPRGGVIGLQLTTAASPVPVLLDVKRLGAFLDVHEHEIFVCVGDAAETHWGLHDALVNQKDESARKALWRLSRDSRWVDLGLMDRLSGKLHQPLSDYRRIVGTGDASATIVTEGVARICVNRGFALSS